MRYCFTAIFGLMFWNNAWAASIQSDGRCQIIYSLKGDSQSVFENQAAQLAHHIQRLDIALIDLNGVHNKKPYTDMSGRERRRFKQGLSLINDESVALVMLNQSMIYKTSGSVDLTLLIQICQQHLDSLST